MCCRLNGSPPLVYNSALGTGEAHPVRPPGLPPELIAEIDDRFLGLHRGQEPPGPCVWYDERARRCRHYRWRPPVCREYEIGSPSCLADRERGLADAAADAAADTAVDA